MGVHFVDDHLWAEDVPRRRLSENGGLLDNESGEEISMSQALEPTLALQTQGVLSLEGSV